MKNKLFFIIVLISIITGLAASFISTIVYYEFYIDDSKKQLKSITKLTSVNPDNWEDYNNIHIFVNDIIKSVEYRIHVTVIEKNGNIIYNNEKDNIENYGDRPEIVQAFVNGFGESTRYSDTMGKNTFYYALKLDTDTVLRFSRELDSIKDVFIDIIPHLIILFILLIFAVMLISSLITKQILKPVRQMITSLDDMMEKEENDDLDIYEEFVPLAHKIKEQKTIISEYINELKYERDTIEVITENMKEGLILLNNDRNILSINSSSKRMIGNETFNKIEHKNILELTRNVDIINNIDEAINKNKHIVFDIDTNRNNFRYYISPVTEKYKDKIAGLLILIEDVTIQKNAEIMRREFSANVSHELKTPLTTMIGFAEMIKEGLITDIESIKKYCGMINAEGLRLITLLEDIMRLSKIEEGVEVENTVVNLKEISTEICKLLKPKSDSKNIEIILKAENIFVIANRSYMNELIYNLVENGIKYNKNGGKVEIFINKKDGSTNIVVKDTGVGIPEEYQARIFERFYRVDKSRSKETGGTGLGLSIAKHIVEMYEGSITLESKVNIGTTIIVKLPNKK